ncbi:MAG: ATPase, T2SS/T4P/T4SS family [Candidatus Wallbacteria bacterium]|nr:ATPase, T2SS/T4P/T4SS family [Candidatus Wallbacteria bacterium]
MISEFIGRKKIGQILLEMGAINEAQLADSLEIQKTNDQLIGQVMIAADYLDDVMLAKALAKQFGVQYHDLGEFEIDHQLMEMLPDDLIKMYYFLPYSLAGNRMTIIIHDPTNVAMFDAIHVVTGLDIDYLVAPKSKLEEKIGFFYSLGLDGHKRLEDVSVGDILDEVSLEFVQDGGEDARETDLLKAADQKPIIALVNKILLEAIKESASDIHIEAEEDMVQVRYRIDGVLYNKMPIAKKASSAIVSRIKIMADLDIAERRIPQDGAFSVVFGRAKIDFRISILPSINGENVVMRILSRENIRIDLRTLGFNQAQYDLFLRNIAKPYGMNITSGPTGSGKTTTLYAALNELKSSEVKIITVEDPVEYQLAGVLQAQVFINKNDPERSMTFAKGLRSILRHDPDIILIGEIRDGETAEIAVNSALTGHLVFSTLHANNALDVVARFSTLGIESYLLSSALNMIIAQRLVRRLCTCKEQVEPTPQELLNLGRNYDEYKDRAFYKPVGCEKCFNIGYKGRIAIFEILSISTEIREMILTGENMYEIGRAARKQGYVTLLESAFEKSLDGITSLKEVERYITD